MMPVYRGEAFIAEAVESILAQSHENWELLALDDCSPDGSVSILESFNDSRIRILRNEKNRGVAFGRTRCVQEAKGEFCAWLDQDDYSEPDRLALQVEAFRADPELVLCGSAIRVFGDGERIENVPLDHHWIKASLLFENPFATSALMFRTQIFRNHDLTFRQDLFPAEDFDVFSKIVFLGRARNLPEVLTHYRLHPGQGSSNKERLVRGHNYVIDTIVRRLLAEYSEEDANIHHRISQGIQESDPDFIERADAWLARLEEANRQKQVFEPMALQSVLASRWKGICHSRIGNSFHVARLYFQGHALRSGAVSRRGRFLHALRLALGPYKRMVGL